MFTLYRVNAGARIRGFFPLLVSGIAASVALSGDTVGTYQSQNATSPENQIIDRSNTLTLFLAMSYRLDSHWMWLQTRRSIRTRMTLTACWISASVGFHPRLTLDFNPGRPGPIRIGH